MCEKCSAKFSTPKAIKAHISRNHVREKAELLAKLESQEIELLEKRLSKQRENMVKCPICELFFQNTCNGITRHIAKVHPTFMNETRTERAVSNETEEENETVPIEDAQENAATDKYSQSDSQELPADKFASKLTVW